MRQHVTFVEKDSQKRFANYKYYQQVKEECHFTGKYRSAVHSICNLRFNVTNEIPVVFNDGPNYNYHLIIKELANNFIVQFECLGENKEKYFFCYNRKKKL